MLQLIGEIIKIVLSVIIYFYRTWISVVVEFLIYDSVVTNGFYIDLTNDRVTGFGIRLLWIIIPMLMTYLDYQEYHKKITEIYRKILKLI